MPFWRNSEETLRKTGPSQEKKTRIYLGKKLPREIQRVNLQTSERNPGRNYERNFAKKFNVFSNGCLVFVKIVMIFGIASLLFKIILSLLPVIRTIIIVNTFNSPGVPKQHTCLVWLHKSYCKILLE